MNQPETVVSPAQPRDRTRSNFPLTLWLVGCGLLVFDQLTKQWARLTLAGEPLQAYAQGLFYLTYAENSGAFLSVGANWSPTARFAAMVVFNAVMLIGIAVLVWRQSGLHRGWVWGWGLILVGGIGNLIDRVLNAGQVIDFMNLGIGSLRSGIFNFADVYLSVGFVVLGVCSFSTRSESSDAEELAAKSAEPAAATDAIAASKTAAAMETGRFSEADSARETEGVGVRGAVQRVLLSGCLLGWGVNTAAAESVIYKAGSRGGHVALSGEILDYTQQHMVFRVKSPDTIHHLREEQIVSFDAYFLPAHQEALQALEKRQFGSAVTLAEQALKSESRGWVRRELIGLQIQAALNQQQWTTAANLYRALLESDPAPRNQDLIPLCWGEQTLAASDLAWAQRELKAPEQALRLVAASWLLEGEHSRGAQAVLNDLLVSPVPHIRQLARSQLWRLRLQANDFNDGDVDRWERRLQDLPDGFKAGPTFVLAQGREKRVQTERAAADYLWIPIMDARRIPLARTSLLNAARLLERIGQSVSAERLQLEARQRFDAAGE